MHHDIVKASLLKATLVAIRTIKTDLSSIPGIFKILCDAEQYGGSVYDRTDSGVSTPVLGTL